VFNFISTATTRQFFAFVALAGTIVFLSGVALRPYL
jgi:hypothetical protein